MNNPKLFLFAGVRYQFAINQIVRLTGRKEGCSHLRRSLCSQPSALCFVSLLPLSVDLSPETRDYAWTYDPSLIDVHLHSFPLPLVSYNYAYWLTKKAKIHFCVKVLFYYVCEHHMYVKWALFASNFWDEDNWLLSLRYILLFIIQWTSSDNFCGLMTNI